MGDFTKIKTHFADKAYMDDFIFSRLAVLVEEGTYVEISFDEIN